MSLIPVTVRNATDTSVAEGQPTTVFNTTTRLRLRASGSGAQNFAYIHFPRPFPLGVTVVSAKLRVFAQGATWPALSRTMTLKTITESWKAGRTTWNNKPTVTTTGQVAVTKTGAISDQELWEFDVTALMQAVADGGAWWGWRLELNENVLRRLYSAQAAGHKPRLVVTYSTRPQAPTELSPSGYRVVVPAKPVLRFDFTDHAGNTTMQACQVQLNATNVWTAPSFDSGTVLTSVPQLDLNATAYAGLAEGASTYWRVRVQDGSGQWSSWSTAARFQRAARGTLTITNPSGSTVGSAAPQVTWTFTGRTQAAWQVILTDADGDHWLWTSGKFTSAATSCQVPSGLIHDSTTYRIYVRIWDNLDREGTVSEPPFTEAYRSVTWALNAGTTGVSNGAIARLSYGPGVQLDWTRATDPTAFIVLRDGRTIAYLDPDDCRVSGTAFRYVDFPDSRHAHVYTVRAEASGLTSQTNPTLNLAASGRTGIWLCDPEQGTYVHLLGQENGSWAMGEDAETYFPRGSTRPVRITQGLRGYEGSIAGLLEPLPGDTLDDALADLWRMKVAAATEGRTFVLVLSDLAIPCGISVVCPAPTPRADIERAVTFDFWQVDDLPFEAYL